MYMKHSNISVGLDIGTTKIVAMVGTKNEFNKVERVGKSKSLGVIEEWLLYHANYSIYSTSCRGSAPVSGKDIEEVVVDSWTTYKESQHSDYITESQEVISADDIERLIQQVYKLVMLPGEEIIHVYLKNIK